MTINLFLSGLILLSIFTNTFANTISTQDEQYLRQILKETWAYLDSHLAPQTGFPTDSQTPGGNTNTTNIGLYLAAIGPAQKMGFISKSAALQRITKIIESLEKIESRNGFIYNWIDVTGDTKIPEGIMALSDFNKLITGLILVRQFFPEIAEKASPLIERVQWSKLYDPATGTTRWGYDLKNDKFIGSGNFWLASDSRTVMFYMIATDSAPVEIWNKAKNDKICVDDLSFYEPGYWFGGLFMQAMDAIFLESPATIQMGNSIGDFAWRQIQQSHDMNLKVWGWSNCNIPGKGYTEGGYLPWWVVTPHASAIVIEYYPQHVIKNLRTLGSLGLHKPLIDNKQFGFRDSIDLRTGKVDDRYLSLDQAMLFLSITNYLENGMVRNYYAKDPLVIKCFAKLKKQFAQDPNLLLKWAKRDATEPPPIAHKKTLDFTLDMTQSKNITYKISAAGAKADSNFTPEGLCVDFTRLEETGEINLDVNFPAIDIKNLQELRITCKGKSENEFGGIRICLFDNCGQSQYCYTGSINSEMKEYIIPESSILGMLANPTAANKINLKLWSKPWFYMNQLTSAQSGTLTIQKIIFKYDKNH